MPQIAIAVVCRLKSTRLTFKALRLIHGVPSVQRCLNNCLAVSSADSVVLATSTDRQDDPLQIFDNASVTVLRGSPDNLADRMLSAAKATGADVLLRVTADCPSVSSELLERQIEHHLATNADLTLPPADTPIGIGGDVYSVSALYRLVELSRKYHVSLEQSEYLSFFFINNPTFFKVERLPSTEEFRYPAWRLTLDEMKDLHMYEALYAGIDADNRPVAFAEIRDYLIAHPEIARMNADIQTKWKDKQEIVEQIRQSTTFVLP